MTREFDDSSDLPPRPPVAELDWRMVDRHLAGVATEDDRVRMRTHLERNPHLAARWAALQATLAPARFAALAGTEAEHAIAQTRQRVRELLAEEDVTRASRAKAGWFSGGARPSARQAMGWTAAIAIATCFAVFGGRFVLGRSHESDAPLYVFTTRAGEHKIVTLEGGTTIALAPNTQLAIGGRLGEVAQTVQLRAGEGYFDVAPATRAPFVVHTGRVETRVLGTRFAIVSDSSGTVQVAVTSGKVSSRGAGGAVVVTAGQVARLTDSTATVVTRDDRAAYTDWSTGRLVFKDVPIPVMLATVGRWYGYEFRLADSALAARTVTLTLKAFDAADMVSALKGTLDVNMTVTDHVAILTPRVVRVDKTTRGTFAPKSEFGR